MQLLHGQNFEKLTTKWVWKVPWSF